MKKTELFRLIFQSFSILLFKKDTPLFATLIVTDRCNLSCRHCTLHNYHEKSKYTFEQICEDMKKLYKMGVRILCFSGGEIGLWNGNGHTIKELIEAARKTGFVYVALATNGTIAFDYGDADFILISIDGTKKTHDAIRGESYNKILSNIRNVNLQKGNRLNIKNTGTRKKVPAPNIVIFMEINQLNKKEIHSVCRLAKEEPNIKAVSFNFHTPFHGTRALALSKKEKVQCCREIIKRSNQGYPVANMKSCLRYLVSSDFKKPCRQLVVMDAGEVILCNRCSREEGLCDQCGYFETAEIAMMFRGKLNIWLDALRTYGKYLF